MTATIAACVHKACEIGYWRPKGGPKFAGLVKFSLSAHQSLAFRMKNKKAGRVNRPAQAIAWIEKTV
jgi:hypothetical protein